jgi:DNA-binding LacI/PurR family transcriptional regulator/DNA-binding transcriptional regulator YhcF (GntR family)
MAAKRFAAIAVDIERTLSLKGDIAVKTVTQVAEHYGVSYPTAWNAVRILCRKGLVRSVAGKGIVAVHGQSGLEPVSSADLLHQKIHAAILDGDYKAGKSFPKTRYFVITHRVSHSTVIRAFLKLAAKNLAHKQGNQWIAGPDPALLKQHVPAASSAPVALCILGLLEANILEVFSNFFTAPFLMSFRNELNRWNIAMKFGACKTNTESPFPVPVGIDEIIAHIRSSGQSYWGTMVMLINPPFFSLEKIIPRLVQLGKPVVYFDSTEEGDYVTRTLSYPKRFYRLHQDQPAAVKKALETLVGKGHRVIGVHGADMFDWSARRVALIKDIASKMNPAPAIIEAQPSADEPWSIRNPVLEEPLISKETQALSMAAADGKSPVRKNPILRHRLLSRVPAFVSLLRDHNVTAIIALSDHLAREYYFWFRALGIQTPGHITMVSFDNELSNIPFPISSIDFGFERLGYLAAHILMGDIPVRSDRRGNIPGIPILMDRGSIGPPGDTAGLKRLLTA